MLTEDNIAQRDALWQCWIDLQASAEEALLQSTTHYFACIRKAVCDKLTLEALTSARLGQKDEEVYSHLAYLMGTYREVICLFENRITAPAPELVAGLCDILNSRLRQFEDVYTGHENPVLNEKLGILEKAVLHTTRQIEDLEKNYTNESIQALIKDIFAVCSDTAWHTLKESIISKTLPDLQPYYKENLHRILASIDDLHTRETTSFYTDLLEREWEVLGLIIQVQVKAIETVCPDPDETSPILSKLREAYQQTGPIVSGFRKLMQNATPSLAIDPAVSREWLEECLILPQPMEIDSQPLVSALMHEADFLFEQLRHNHLETAQDLNKKIEDELSLSEEILAIFEKAEYWLATMPELSPPSIDNKPTLYEACEAKLDECEDSKIEANNNEEGPSSPIINPESEIISGITETLQIKIESLKESLELFKTNSANLLSNIFSDIPILSSQDLQNAANHIKMCWCANPPSQELINDFVEECISLAPFTAYNDKINKSIAIGLNKIEKAVFHFRKETLLYEISTYEEILYYSVSRLRESVLPPIASAVKILDETFQAFENLLSNKDIEIIHPNPHELFNGREHEILTAEEQEGFIKGEIIKTMTSGYKADDQIILRANVVAAR